MHQFVMIASLLLAIPTLGAAGEPGHPPADLVVTHARVYTADPARSIAEAIAVSDGRIVYVGSNAGAEAWVGPKTRVEAESGRLVLPGLYDSHIHPAGIVDLDVCDLKSAALSLAQITVFVRDCIQRYKIPAGEWVIVRQWNFSGGNVPDATHPTLRAALDLASKDHPIQLLGNDGHHGAFNSVALARAVNDAHETVGYSKATLAGDFASMKKLVGVDADGEPNGAVNEEARRRMGTPSMLSVDFAQVMKDPGRVTARLNSVGITGIMDAVVTPASLRLYEALERKGQMTVRASLAQFYDPDEIARRPAAPTGTRCSQAPRTSGPGSRTIR